MTEIALTPTPTGRVGDARVGDVRDGFATLLDALEYAGEAETGMNFYDARGRLTSVLTYRELQRRARDLGTRLAALDLPRGAHVGIVAESHPAFMSAFFATRYAALVPVPLPALVNLGGHRQFVDLLRRLTAAADLHVCLASEAFQGYLREATDEYRLVFANSVETLRKQPARPLPERPSADETAYIQYTSGSTRFPRGAMVAERAVLDNVTAIIRDGLALERQDRFCSWLPLYHDMGLVGKMLVPLASQSSVDYLDPRAFALRPRQWLRLLAENRATISFSPPFGYELVTRRLRGSDARRLDLSAWRVAGVGADMIRPDTLERFAEALAPAGFRAAALTPCYGMAEITLAASFTRPGAGIEVDELDFARYEHEGVAAPARAGDDRRGRFIRCGRPLPGYEVEIRDEQGRVLPERRVGVLHMRSPSLMKGYYREPEATAESLSDGWLNTGDLGYFVDGALVITGRAKDLMIVNGRNVWPQDIEFVAEQQPDVRPGDAAAFSTPDDAGGDLLILLIQCREREAQRRQGLARRVHGDLQAEFGVDCRIELVAPHSLPRTTSGKLSRTQTRQNWLAARFEATEAVIGNPE